VAVIASGTYVSIDYPLVRRIFTPALSFFHLIRPFRLLARFLAAVVTKPATRWEIQQVSQCLLLLQHLRRLQQQHQLMGEEAMAMLAELGNRPRAYYITDKWKQCQFTEMVFPTPISS
jgi:hypothetical protein